MNIAEMQELRKGLLGKFMKKWCVPKFHLYGTQDAMQQGGDKLAYVSSGKLLAKSSTSFISRICGVARPYCTDKDAYKQVTKVS